MCRNVLRSDAGLLTFPLLALLAGAIALGSSPILVRLSELEPTATAFYRVALAAPAFLLFSFAPREAPSLAAYSKAQWVGLFWLSAAGAFFALDLFCLHWSLRRTSVVNATLFLNFAPIFVSLAAWALFGELPTRRAVVSYVIAIGGVALLLGEVATVARGRLVGDLLGLAAGAAYGGYLLVVSRFRYKMPTSLIMGVTTLSCACFILPATLAMGESLVPRTVTGWGTLLALALLTHAGGQGLLVFAMKYFPAFTSSVTLLLQPLVAACGAWILFDETLGPSQMLGGVVVLFGILLCHDASTRAGVTAATRRKEPGAAT
ncbi:MAG: DMT family transporter [Alphaproteobacteria bacterium]|nr:MAG: DMT family transporter [Alphaproteobacteria bacterium]